MKKGKRPPRRKIVAPKECYFCVEKKDPSFSDAGVLQRFVTERGKMIGRVRSGLCARHQRRLTDAIKHARYLAIIPYISRS